MPPRKARSSDSRRESSSDSGSGPVYVKQKLTMDQYQDVGVLFTRRELALLWQLLEDQPELVDKTHWLKEKMERAQEVYATDLRSMGNSLTMADLSHVDGLEVTGHAGLYCLDVYVAVALCVLSGVVLFPSEVADFLLREITRFHGHWHDIPEFYSFAAVAVAAVAMLTVFALEVPARRKRAKPK